MMVNTTTAVQNTGVTRTFDVHRVRADFPILRRTVHGKPLVYLDSLEGSVG